MRNRRSARRRMVVSVLVALCIVLLLAAVYHAGRWLEGQSERQVVRGDHLQRYQYEESVEIDGVAYRRKRNQTAILLMGIDRIEAAAVGDYRNGGQADFLRLVILDKDEQSIKQIQIDRVGTLICPDPNVVCGIFDSSTGGGSGQKEPGKGLGPGATAAIVIVVLAVVGVGVTLLVLFLMGKILRKKTEDKEEKRHGHYLRREFSYSKFQQTMVLPDDVQKDKISAKVENGVLNVIIPKVEKAKPEDTRRVIDIQ